MCNTKTLCLLLFYIVLFFSWGAGADPWGKDRDEVWDNHSS